MVPTSSRVRTLFDRAAENAAEDAAALLSADIACVTVPDPGGDAADSILVYFARRDTGPLRTGSQRVATEQTERLRAVLATGRVIAGDLGDDPNPPPVLHAAGIRAYLLAPIVLPDEAAARGVLYLARVRPRLFTPTERRQAQHLAAGIGRLLERARRQVQAEEQLDSLARAIAAGATQDEAMQAALQATLTAAEADTAVAQVLEGDQIVYRTFLDRAGRRRAFGRAEAVRVRPGGATEEVMRTGRLVLLPDLAAMPSLHPATRARGARSSAHVPVFVDAELAATLVAEWRAPGACTDERVRQLERFAAYLAVALSHLRQREAAERRATEQRLLAAATAAIAAAPDAVSAVDAFLHGVRALTEATALRAVVYASAATAGFERALAADGESGEEERAAQAGSAVLPVPAPADTGGVSLVSIEQDVDGRRQLIVPLRAGGSAVGTLRADLPAGAAKAAEQRLAVEALTGAVGAAIARAGLAVAEQAAAEQAVLAQEQLTAALHSSATMVITYDLDGIIESVTGASVAVLGWAPEELVGQPMTVLILPEEHERFARKLALRRGGGRDLIQYETLNRHRDGQNVPVFITSGPRLERGVVVGGAGAVTDLTRLHRLEQERDEAQAARTRAETAIRTGRAVVHELASPLGAVLGLAELLTASAELPQAVRRDVQLLHAEVMRVGELLHRFGQIVRYEERASPAGPQLDIERASREAATRGQ